MRTTMTRMDRLRAVLLLGLTGGAACTQGPARAASQAPPASSLATPGTAAPTLKAIARDPSAWLDKETALTGTLENQGANYFTDLRVVLMDAEGNAIAVKPWLPTALPPGPKAGATRPPTLAQFLGKRVTLRAFVRQGELRGVAKAYYLEVKDARPVD
jgi:hypothetical protein